MSGITVVSYNLGANYRDYIPLYPDGTEENYETAEKFASDQLVEQSADIYCLQEVVSEDRELIKFLKKESMKSFIFQEWKEALIQRLQSTLNVSKK